MSTQIQRRRGTTAEHGTFTGVEGELTVDTTKDTVVVHDGSQIGGFPLLREDGSNSALALGSQGTPSLKFTGDANTGIYSPGADQVAISTGGTGRLFVDASGNVGIGLTPNYPLDVKVDTDKRLQCRTIGSELQLQATNLANSAYAPIYVGGSIYGVYTNGSERLRITSDGKLGLGTSSPVSNIEAYANYDATGANANTNILTLTAFDGTGGYYYSNQGAGIAFRSGQVTRAPQVMGAIYGANTSDQSTANGQLTFHTRSSDTVAERMRIDSSGRVGIGTTSPSAPFAVSNNNAAGLEIDPTARSSQPALTSYNRSGAAFTRLTYNALEHYFETSSSPRLTIDSSGRLLVGTSTSLGNNATLQTAGQQVNYQAFYSATAQAGPFVILSKSRGTQASPTSVAINDYLGIIGFSGYDGTDYATRGAEIAAMVDGTPGANDMPGRLVFSTTADGASSPTERMTIRSNGQTYWGSSAPSSSSFGFSIGRNGATGLFEGYRNSNGGGVVFEMGGNSGTAYIKGDGDLENTNNSYGGISDIKLKDNIVDANSQWDDIKALHVRNYNFKASTGYSTHTQIGLVAQEVELVSPGLVGESINEETGESVKSVNYSVLYMKAVKALQEAMERIETLEAKVAALESA